MTKDEWMELVTKHQNWLDGFPGGEQLRIFNNSSGPLILKDLTFGSGLFDLSKIYLENVTFENCKFLNSSFHSSDWNHYINRGAIEFEKCQKSQCRYF